MHGSPSALFYNLAAKSIIDDRVQECQVNLPDFFRLLGGILLIPDAEKGLISQVHWLVNVALFIFIKLYILDELVVDCGQLLPTDRVVEVSILDISVVVVLSVHIRSILHELWLGVLVDDIHCVCAIVEVLPPVDADVVRAWDVLPICLVLLSQLCTRFCNFSCNGVHSEWCEGRCDNKEDARDDAAHRPPLALLHLL